MIDQVWPANLDDWFAAVPGSTLLLDVREPHECQYVSVQPQSAQLLQWPMRSIPARWQELQRDSAIAVLCHHGGRSMQVALFLQQCGFERVANVAGGIDAWAQQLDPALPRY